MTNNNNQYYIPKLPEINTIAYFDVETDQNLTQEEWNKLHPANPDEITIINKSGSNFRSDKEGYGPAPLSDTDRRIASGVGVGGMIGVGVLTFFCPPVGVAIATSCAATSVTAKVVGSVVKDEEIKNGMEIIEIFSGTSALGGGVSKLNGVKCQFHSHR